MIKSHVLYRLSYALPRAPLGHGPPLSKPKSRICRGLTRTDPRGSRGAIDLFVMASTVPAGAFSRLIAATQTASSGSGRSDFPHSPPIGSRGRTEGQNISAPPSNGTSSAHRVDAPNDASEASRICRRHPFQSSIGTPDRMPCRAVAMACDPNCFPSQAIALLDRPETAFAMDRPGRLAVARQSNAAQQFFAVALSCFPRHRSFMSRSRCRHRLRPLSSHRRWA